LSKISTKPIERTNALTLSNDCKNFLAASKDLNTLYGNRKISKPVYFLVLRSIELGFKSLLKMHEGFSTVKLKNKYGHNLRKLMNHCLCKNYISLGKESVEAINMISDYYDKNKRFEYTSIGYMELPHLKYFFTASEDINKELENLRDKTDVRRFL
jgi:predicted S18 family serine protease